MNLDPRKEPSCNHPQTVLQPKLMTSRVEFILVCVRGEDDEMAERIRGVCEIAEQYGADFDLAGSMILLTYGTLAHGGSGS